MKAFCLYLHICNHLIVHKGESLVYLFLSKYIYDGYMSCSSRSLCALLVCVSVLYGEQAVRSLRCGKVLTVILSTFLQLIVAQHRQSQQFLV